MADPQERALPGACWTRHQPGVLDPDSGSSPVTEEGMLEKVGGHWGGGRRGAVNKNWHQKPEGSFTRKHPGTSFSFLFFLFFFLRAAPTAYGVSQARGPIGTATASLHHSHGHARSELHL